MYTFRYIGKEEKKLEPTYSQDGAYILLDFKLMKKELSLGPCMNALNRSPIHEKTPSYDPQSWDVDLDLN